MIHERAGATVLCAKSLGYHNDRIQFAVPFDQLGPIDDALVSTAAGYICEPHVCSDSRASSTRETTRAAIDTFVAGTCPDTASDSPSFPRCFRRGTCLCR